MTRLLDLSDQVISRRALIAEGISKAIASDLRVRRCKSIDFADDGGVMVAVELIPSADAKNRDVIARELEFAVAEAVPALPWARVQIV
jgi:hypothetical protein